MLPAVLRTGQEAFTLESEGVGLSAVVEAVEDAIGGGGCAVGLREAEEAGGVDVDALAAGDFDVL